LFNLLNLFVHEAFKVLKKNRTKNVIPKVFFLFDLQKWTIISNDCSKAVTLTLLLVSSEDYGKRCILEGGLLCDILTKLNKLSNSISIISLQSHSWA